MHLHVLLGIFRFLCAVENIIMQFSSHATVAYNFIYPPRLLQPLQTVAKTAADHVRACVDRGVTDAVLNLAAPGGRGLSLRLAPSIIFCVGGRAAATETFLTERASGLRASSVCKVNGFSSHRQAGYIHG